MTGYVPVEQVIEQHTEAVHVAPHRCRLAGEQLRCEIQRRAGRSGRPGRRLEARPEVHQHDATVVGADDVVRLDIAVNQSRMVDGGDRAGKAQPD